MYNVYYISADRRGPVDFVKKNDNRDDNQIGVHGEFKGIITRQDYDEYIQKLYATGNTYDVQFEVQIADANPGKKTENQQIGDMVYYSVYTSQVEDKLATGNYVLKEGDFVSVSVKNTNTTISQMIKNVLYSVTGDQSYVISAQASGAVVTTGY